ncbi:MAG: hypothetical protein ACYS7Y_35135, partial [Planctomycetota bacterium]
LLSFGSTVVFQQVFNPGLILFLELSVAALGTPAFHVPTAAEALIQRLVDFGHGSGVFGYVGEDVGFEFGSRLFRALPMSPYRQQSFLVWVTVFAPPPARHFR